MGGNGLVMVEATAVLRSGRITHKCLGLYSDANERALQQTVDICRRYGTGKLAIQLGHAGRKASVQPPADGGKPLTVAEDPWTTYSASTLPFAPDYHVPVALDKAGIEQIKAGFVDATQRAARIGFDLVELHMAHGYLIHQFLSPISNKRSDEYGGSLQNRLRLALEIFAACRAVWPDDKPMGVRVSATDYVEGGWTVEDTVVLARELKKLGCDFIDVSSGGLDPRQKLSLGPGYQVPFAEKIRREAGIATIAVGMIVDPHQAERVVSTGQADMVALARAMMLNPRWAWQAAQQLHADAPLPPNYARAHPKNWPQAFEKKAAE
jgi:2,4-dienoyl-CoA reductase-like NADH-dependent reductase (Old Yellow Enzyme family)